MGLSYTQQHYSAVGVSKLRYEAVGMGGSRTPATAPSAAMNTPCCRECKLRLLKSSLQAAFFYMSFQDHVPLPRCK